MAGWVVLVVSVLGQGLIALSPRDLLFCMPLGLLAVIAYWSHLTRVFLRWRQG